MNKRVDDNQQLIVQALRRVGASILYLHTLGRGCPDILVGFRNQNTLIEIKNGSLSPSKRKLTTDETAWHAEWRGAVVIVATVHEALAAIGAVEGDA